MSFVANILTFDNVHIQDVSVVPNIFLLNTQDADI